MLREAERHAVFLRRLLPQAANVLLRAHLHGVHAVELRGIVEKVIVVHGLGHEIARARLVVQRHQAVGIEVFRLPERADVLIAEF